jgi:hypothetical protein
MTLFCLVTFQNIAAADNKSWEQILEDQILKVPDIELNSNASKEMIITKSVLDGKDHIMHEIENYLKNNYEPILMSMYLSYSLRNNKKDDKVLEQLYKFHKDQKNCISNYYLSYYYLLNKDFNKCLNYLEKGNKFSYNSYISTAREMIYSYLIDNSFSEIAALAVSVNYIDSDQYTLFRSLSRTLCKIENNNDFSESIVLFGKNIEKNSPNILGKLIGIVIQMDGWSKKGESKKYDDLQTKYIMTNSLPDKLKKKTGEKGLKNYLETVRLKGEYFALMNLEK